MMKIPVENLGLFEQLDRIVVAFFSKATTFQSLRFKCQYYTRTP